MHFALALPIVSADDRTPDATIHRLMQPKRDPDDARYWPATHGGIGTGFTARGKEASPYRYGIIRRTIPRTFSMDDVKANTAPEYVRAKARATLLLAIERVDAKLNDVANELTLNELSQSVSSLGRIAGVQQDDAKTGDIRIHIVRDELPTLVRARLLSAGVNDAQPVEAQDVTVDVDGDAQA